MKRIIFFCFTVLLLGACSNNDDLGTHISDEIQTTFQDMYPGAKGVEWGKIGVYKVAYFTYNGSQLTAWYNQESVWCMTETRMDLMTVPSRVANAYRGMLANSNNAQYVDKLTRDGIEEIYVVVESATGEPTEYYFSTDGLSIKVLSGETLVYGDYRNEIVPQIPASVYTTVEDLYPGSRIVEVDVIFPGILYIEAIHDSTLMTLEFSLTGS